MLGAESRQAIAKVLVSSGAAVGGVALPQEGAVLADDVVTTAKGGRALLEFSPTTRGALAEETSVCFRKSEDRLVAEVSKGALVAERRESGGLVVETSKYKVEAIDQGKALYMVAMLPDKSTIVAARYGQVAITETSSGQSYLLAEGEYAQIPADALGVPQGRGDRAPQAPPQKAHGKIIKPWHIGRLSHAASVALVTAIVVGAALAIAIPLALEEEKPASPVVP
jgi:hypothetical protein